MKPPPSFVYTCSFLMREEKRIAQSYRMETHTALLAVGSATMPSPPSPPATGGDDRCKNRKASATKNCDAGSSSTSTPRPPASGASSQPPSQWASASMDWCCLGMAHPGLASRRSRCPSCRSTASSLHCPRRTFGSP
ncbi:hypothetical protein PVAP13_2KG175616 [Panicum virgatum]|uniref:Uncharacterized protein n=1 Tax=Panicum virgatum TaxID=38727 RepID=A0A8T0W5V2_PANVG|nr:hypothetical protein PVAP13_2KG175616 [Panicum virgatum]